MHLASSAGKFKFGLHHLVSYVNTILTCILNVRLNIFSCEFDFNFSNTHRTLKWNAELGIDFGLQASLSNVSQSNWNGIEGAAEKRTGGHEEEQRGQQVRLVCSFLALVVLKQLID